MKCKSLKELCEEYGVSKPTLIKWISEIPAFRVETALNGKKKIRRIYHPREVEIIYNSLGKPD